VSEPTGAHGVPPHAAAQLHAPVAPVGWDAWRIRHAVAAGELRVEDVVRAHLDRLDEVQPVLNAAVRICRDEALRDALRVQDALDAGEPAGPLCGVPFTVKDTIATAGIETCCGSAAFAGNVPATDAAAVRRLRAAGAILIAKTNCPEFAFGVTTGNPTYGVTRSPWGEHSPGGSSGGEAALVCAAASAFGLGTDYGGSLRWPAQCCGVLALRPGLGTVDGAGQLPERGGRLDGDVDPMDGDVDPADPSAESVQRHFQVVGPLGRSVRDVAMVFDVLCADGCRQYDDRGDASGESVGRVGWIEQEDSEPVGRDVLDSMRDLVAALARDGVSVDPCDGLFDGLHATYNALRNTDDLGDLRTAIGDRRALVGPDALRTLDSAPSSRADPAPLWDELSRRRAAVLEQLERTPVLMFPVAPTSACSLDGIGVVDGETREGFALMAQCRAVTGLGVASLSIPIGRDHGGLPISVQLIAAPGHERRLFRVGARIEMLTGRAPSPPWLDP
jgi:amidase